MRPVVRDILDQLVVDPKQNRMGRVDSVILHLREGKPPRVAYLEMGAAVCANRISKTLARWIQKIEQRLGIKQEDAFRIPWSKIRNIGIDLEVDYEAEKTPADAWEKWVRDHIIKKIPGAAGK